MSGCGRSPGVFQLRSPEGCWLQDLDACQQLCLGVHPHPADGHAVGTVCTGQCLTDPAVCINQSLNAEACFGSRRRSCTLVTYPPKLQERCAETCSGVRLVFLHTTGGVFRVDMLCRRTLTTMPHIYIFPNQSPWQGH